MKTFGEMFVARSASPSRSQLEDHPVVVSPTFRCCTVEITRAVLNQPCQWVCSVCPVKAVQNSFYTGGCHLKDRAGTVSASQFSSAIKIAFCIHDQTCERIQSVPLVGSEAVQHGFLPGLIQLEHDTNTIRAAIARGSVKVG